METGTDREDTLYDEVVELLERGLVRLAERGRELLGRVCLRREQGLAREGEAAEEPEEAFRSSPLLLGLLVHDEKLERGGLLEGSIVPSTDFLEEGDCSEPSHSGTRMVQTHSDVPLQVALDSGESGRSEEV